MSITDVSGRPWAQATQIKAGMKLKTDGDFTCIPEGQIVEVKVDENRRGFSRFFVDCKCGGHYLDGQVGDDGEVLGFYAKF